MSYFPDQIMPKQLKKGLNDVPGYPLAYNARDYNSIHKEIIAIERFLLGDIKAGENGGLNDILNSIKQTVDNIINGTFILNYAGQMISGAQIQLPQTLKYTTNVLGAFGTGTGIIEVASTSGWPNSGILTKFNSNLKAVFCESGGVPPCSPESKVLNNFQNQVNEMTNQEYIYYEVLSSTELNLLSRGLYGTTVQAIGSSDNVIFIPGRASVLFSLGSFLLNDSANITGICIENTADLIARVSITETSADYPSTEILEKEGNINVSYSLIIAGYYDSITINSTGIL